GAVTTANLFAENFFLKMIFVADIENAALRSGDESRDDHAFDEEMRKIGHDEAVLDGAGLAFVCIADNISDGIGMLAYEVPLHAGGESRAAHAFQFGGLELRENVVPGFGWNELANNAVLFAVAVGIGLAGDARLLRMRLVNVFAANGAARD